MLRGKEGLGSKSQGLVGFGLHDSGLKMQQPGIPAPQGLRQNLGSYHHAFWYGWSAVYAARRYVGLGLGLKDNNPSVQTAETSFDTQPSYLALSQLLTNTIVNSLQLV